MYTSMITPFALQSLFQVLDTQVMPSILLLFINKVPEKDKKGGALSILERGHI